MTKIQLPGLHGVQHLPNGSDPIPAVPGFTYSVPSLGLAYLTPGNLEGWWRLGEDATTFPVTATPTTDWAIDSSGHGLHLRAYNVNHTGTGPQLSAGDPSLPTSITGAYPRGDGDPAVDDGGLKFNYAYNDTLNNGGKVGLSRNGVSFGEGYGIPVGGGWSLSAFIMFTGTSIDNPVLGNSDSGTGGGPITWYVSIGAGGSLGILKYSTDLGTVWSSSGALVIGQWYHLAVTVERLATTSYRRRILLNLTELYNTTGTASTIKLASAGSSSLTLGGYWTSSNIYSNPVGLDEVSIWSKALTDEELSNIYNVAVVAGDTWTTDTVPADAIGVDNTTIESDGGNPAKLRVKDDGITAAKIAANAVGSSELAATAVSPGSYGDATHVGQFTVDADGRLTGAANVTVSGGGGTVATDTIWDAKGDLAAGTGADTAAKLAVGTNGQVLTADSAQTLGIKWAAAVGGTTYRVGTGAPAAGLGSLGDLYENLTNGDLYQKQAVAAPSFRSSAASYAGSTTSLAATMPASVAVGDFLVLFMISGQTPSVSGWTNRASSTGGTSGLIYSIFTRVADGTEGASVTVTAGSASLMAVDIVAYQNGVYDSFANSSSEMLTGGGTTITIPSVTTVAASTMLLGIALSYNSSATPFTPGAGWTSRVDASPGGTARKLMVEDKPQLSAGASGTSTITVPTSTYAWAFNLALTVAGGATAWTLIRAAAHATTHQPGGTDAMAVDAAAATGSLRTLGTGAAQAAPGNDTRFLPTDTVVVAGTRILANKLVGTDTYPAFRLFGDGKLEWGLGGGNAPDTSLYRSAANSLRTAGDFTARDGVNSVTIGAFGAGYGLLIAGDTNLYRNAVGFLKTDGRFDVLGDATVGVNNVGKLYFGSNADTNLYRSTTDVLQTDDWLRSSRISATNKAFGAYYGNPSFVHFQILADGKIQWGPGNIDVDTNLYRQAPNALATGGEFAARDATAARVGLGDVIGGGQAGIVFGSLADVNLYRSAPSTLSTSGLLKVDGTGAGVSQQSTSGLLLSFYNVGQGWLQCGPPDSAGAGYRSIRIGN